ncbi:MAG: DUF4168 domain-containing protein [Balneolales bacterium]
MLKFLSAFILVITMIGCEAETESETSAADAPAENPMAGQMQDQMPQIEVSDDELQSFVNIAVEARQIQSESQMEMLAVVEDEGIEVETYNQIAQGLQTGQSQDEIDVTPEDMDKFNRASESIGEIEQEMEQTMASAAEEEGINMERFQEINMAIQQDPELQQRTQQLMQDSGMQQPGPPPQQPDNN